MDRIDTIEVPRTLPRPAAAAGVQAVLAAICSRRPRKPLGMRPRAAVEELPQPGGRGGVGQIAVAVRLPDLPRVLVLGRKPLGIPLRG
jgi:hypothetical protein